MADLSITAANVLAGNGANIEHGKAGVAITAGQVVYRDPSTRKYGLHDSNSGTAAVRDARGIALNGAAANQPLAIIKGGPLTVGATMTAGVAYYGSDTPGGICPIADVGSGEYATVLGIAISTTVINVNIQQSGVAL